MACSNCSKSENGLPRGCKNNGACGIGGCEKLEVYDWLAGMALPDGRKPFNVIEVRFKNDRKHFYRNTESIDLYTGDVVVVEGDRGHDVGVVSLSGELVRYQMRRKKVKDDHEVRKVLRKATQADINTWQQARMREKETMVGARIQAQELKIDMKISDVEYQGDGTKATFYYTAENRVDFRELIRMLANRFGIRIEMRQFGMRQEAARLGGIGSCGRELCCSTWLNDFRSVSTGAARVQQLALNPTKLAGQCGKLKCCLNYELDQYIEASKEFPSPNLRLHTGKGAALHFKTDIFKRMLWYIYEDYRVSNGPVAMSLDSVWNIIEMNKRGEKPEDLTNFAFVEEKDEEDSMYESTVGQDSLTRFDRSKRKKKGKKKSGGERGGQPSGSGKKPTRPDDRPRPEGQPRLEGPPRQEGQPRPAGEGNKNRNRNRNRGRNNDRNRPDKPQQGGGE